MDKLPKDWKNCHIEDIAKNIQYGFTGKTIKNGIVKYLRITDIQSNFVDWSQVPFAEISPKEADKYLLRNNDIVFARTGATAGKSFLIDELKSVSVFASYLIRIVPKTDKIFPKYLYLYFQSPEYWSHISENVEGAAQPNFNGKKLAKIPFPLPPLPDQIRIAAKLEALFTRIDKSINLLEENIKHTKGLMASVLEEVFVNGKNWKREPLSKVAKVERGKSKHRPRNDEKLFGNIYPFIQTGDVRKANKYIERYEVCYSEFGLKQSRLWNKGTICLTIAANIGDVAILGLDACFPDSVVGITPNSMNNEFLYYYLKTLQLQLDKKANSAAQKNINLKILNEIDVPVPSFETQNRIADRFSRLEEKQFEILSTQQSKLAYLKALKSSILDRAFKGEL
ncbi:MAG TPA: restriction endonuclease subunit S [Prolixibacteraceae bacterium]|nr:restriction endonuclease subunit S [Prolixibacteraceae bacterium]